MPNSKEHLIELLKDTEDLIEKALLEVIKLQRDRASKFRQLASMCEHRDAIHKSICRHKELRRQADAAGCNAYLNGCFIGNCSLLKKT